MVRARQNNSADYSDDYLESTSYRAGTQYLPVRIFEMIGTGRITTQECSLLIHVDGMVGGVRDGLGCWASNHYLAKQTHVTVTRLKKSISKLVSMKLLIHAGYYYVHGRRFRTLKTCWSQG